MTSVPWADTPLAMIATPQGASGRDDVFTVGATHMCLLHNAIFRGYNSIYLQAPHITDHQELADFIAYGLAWCRFVQAHHDDEETGLFPAVAQVVDDDAIARQVHAEHERFLDGLRAMHDYLAVRADSPIDLDGVRLQETMRAFVVPFEQHFRSEVRLIAALADHPRAPKPGSPQDDTARALFRAWGRATVGKAGLLAAVPLLLTNHDASPTGFEDGRWAAWPPMPWPVRWGLVHVACAWHGAWWQFASCNAAGQPHVLYALRPRERASGS